MRRSIRFWYTVSTNEPYSAQRLSLNRARRGRPRRDANLGATDGQGHVREKIRKTDWYMFPLARSRTAAMHPLVGTDHIVGDRQGTDSDW